jgi:hypothetical protein
LANVYVWRKVVSLVRFTISLFFSFLIHYGIIDLCEVEGRRHGVAYRFIMLVSNFFASQLH